MEADRVPEEGHAGETRKDEFRHQEQGTLCRLAIFEPLVHHQLGDQERQPESQQQDPFGGGGRFPGAEGEGEGDRSSNEAEVEIDDHGAIGLPCLPNHHHGHCPDATGQ